MKRKFLVLLDRDGTLIQEKHYLSDPDGVELLPGTLEGLRLLQDAGAEFVVVSNQSGIGRGYFTHQQADRVNDRLQALLKPDNIRIAGFYLCPHSPEERCRCRKPEPGLLQRAAMESRFSLDKAFMIGDKASDIEAGKRAGCKTVLVLTGYGRQSQSECTPDYIANNLKDAAEWIIGQVAAEYTVK